MSKEMKSSGCYSSEIDGIRAVCSGTGMSPIKLEEPNSTPGMSTKGDKKKSKKMKRDKQSKYQDL